MLLFCKLFVVVTVVIGIIVDVRDPGVMQRPPRKQRTSSSRPQIVRWLITEVPHRPPAYPARSCNTGPTNPAPTAIRLDDDGLRHRRVHRAVNVGLVIRRERQAPCGLHRCFPSPGLDPSRLAPHLGRLSSCPCSSNSSRPHRSPVASGWSYFFVITRPGIRRRRQGPPDPTPRPTSPRIPAGHIGRCRRQLSRPGRQRGVRDPTGLQDDPNGEGLGRPAVQAAPIQPRTSREPLPATPAKQLRLPSITPGAVLRTAWGCAAGRRVVRRSHRGAGVWAA